MKTKESFTYVFQVTRKVMFYVIYNKETRRFATCSFIFNQPKTSYELKEGILANESLTFFDKWNYLHLIDPTTEQYNEIIKDIETLKEKYNYMVKLKTDDYYWNFADVKELSK